MVVLSGNTPSDHMWSNGNNSSNLPPGGEVGQFATIGENNLVEWQDAPAGRPASYSVIVGITTSGHTEDQCDFLDTGDGVAVQAAFDACEVMSATSFPTILFLPGNYVAAQTGPWTYGGTNLSMYGTPRFTALTKPYAQRTETPTVLQFTNLLGTNVFMSGLSISRYDNVGLPSIQVDSMNAQFYIDRCMFIDSGTTPTTIFNLTGRLMEFSASNTMFSSNRIIVAGNGMGYDRLEFYSCPSIIAKEAMFELNPAGGILGLRIGNCYLDETKSLGNPTSVTSFEDAVITGCAFELKDSAGVGLGVFNNSNITGCRFENELVSAATLALQMSNSVFNGNRIMQVAVPTTAGLMLTGASDANIVSNNNVANGTDLGASTTNNVVAHNIGAVTDGGTGNVVT